MAVWRTNNGNRRLLTHIPCKSGPNNGTCVIVTSTDRQVLYKHSCSAVVQCKAWWATYILFAVDLDSEQAIWKWIDDDMRIIELTCDRGRIIIRAMFTVNDMYNIITNVTFLYTYRVTERDRERERERERQKECVSAREREREQLLAIVRKSMRTDSIIPCGSVEDQSGWWAWM
jgi:hypothetical protein